MQENLDKERGGMVKMETKKQKIKVARIPNEVVAWFDERPCCPYVLRSWRAGCRIEDRCERYPYCHYVGKQGICALDDPNFKFGPDFGKFAEHFEDSPKRTPLLMDLWLEPRKGDIIGLKVVGNSMSPTYNKGDVVGVLLGHPVDEGEVGIVQFLEKLTGIPLKGTYLKRILRKNGLLILASDNSEYERIAVTPKEIRVIGPVIGVNIFTEEQAKLFTEFWHFAPDGKIVSLLTGGEVLAGLDIYCREDIANALLAAEEASAATAAAMIDIIGDPVKLRAYREGYRAALATVALAFGLSPRKGTGKGPEITFAAAFGDLPEPQLNENRRMISYLDQEAREK